MQIKTDLVRARRRSTTLVVIMLIGSAGCGESVADELGTDELFAREPSEGAREADAVASPSSGGPTGAGVLTSTGWASAAAPTLTRDAGSFPPVARYDAGAAVGEGCAPSAWPDAGRSAAICTGRVFGDGKTCASFELLKQLAVAACSSDGLTLTDMKIGDECEGGATTGWASCCGGHGVPTRVDAGVAHATPVCISDYIADGSCMDYQSMLLKVTAVCEAQGLELTDLYGSISDICPTGMFEAKYQCCVSGVM